MTSLTKPWVLFDICKHVRKKPTLKLNCNNQLSLLTLDSVLLGSIWHSRCSWMIDMSQISAGWSQWIEINQVMMTQIIFCHYFISLALFFFTWYQQISADFLIPVVITTVLQCFSKLWPHLQCRIWTAPIELTKSPTCNTFD